MKRILAIILLTTVFLSGCSSDISQAGGPDPFGHIYRVAETLVSEDPSGQERILIHLDGFHNLWIMEDTATYDFIRIGEFKESKPEPEEMGDSRWIITAEDADAIAYELTADETGAVVFTQLQENTVLQSCRLVRVDMLSVNVSSAGTREFLETDWYFTDTFSGDRLQLSSGTIHRKGKIGFSLEDESIDTLTITEAYYTDGNPEYSEIQLTKETGFHIDAATKYDTGVQYALYRIPYENGEFIFYIKYD